MNWFSEDDSIMFVPATILWIAIFYAKNPSVLGTKIAHASKVGV
jgi:hypothetical protein